MNAKTLGALPKGKIHFIEPMYARLVSELPEGKEWLYEVKFDGYRCLAGRDSTKVTFWSRRENLFTDQFPHIARACEQLSPGLLSSRIWRNSGAHLALQLDLQLVINPSTEPRIKNVVTFLLRFELAF